MSGEKVNIAVFVSGGGTNLQALLDKQKSGVIRSGEIKLVISSSKDAYALKRAEKAGVPGVVVSKKECGSQAEFEKRILAYLKEYNIELIVLAGFMCILSESFTSKYPKRIVNVHPSLIPSFCGKGFYGLHVHEAGGEIIMQKAVEVSDGDTPETLQKRVMVNAEWIILPQAVEKVSAELLKNK